MNTVSKGALDTIATEGAQLEFPSRTIGNVEIFSYLGGDAVHYKVTNEGHGATHGISEQRLLDFLDGAQDASAADRETQRDNAYDRRPD